MNANMDPAVDNMNTELRHDWRDETINALFELPLNDLLFEAQRIHRQNFKPNQVQVSTLLSIKTGKCPEDCSYCPQSVRYDTSIKDETLMPLDEVIEAAKVAKEKGSSRFCMGAAWRSPKDRDMAAVIDMVKAVKEMGMETCLTLGMLSEKQTEQLRTSLDFSVDLLSYLVTTVAQQAFYSPPETPDSIQKMV